MSFEVRCANLVLNFEISHLEERRGKGGDDGAAEAEGGGEPEIFLRALCWREGFLQQ
jgi:hypothetical protein